MTIVTDALTTLARAKVFLGIGSDRYDDALVMLINQVTGFIKQYCKREFKTQTYTNEEYDGTGRPTLLLRNFPVTALTTLQERNTTHNTDNWKTMNSQYYHWYEDGRVTNVTQHFAELPKHYRATYVAGYKIDFANEANTSLHTLPMELEYATQKLVSALFNTRKAEGFGSTKTGDQSVVLKKEIFSDSEIKAILDKYAAPNF